jgi:hypothetical protein
MRDGGGGRDRYGETRRSFSPQGLSCLDLPCQFSVEKARESEGGEREMARAREKERDGEGERERERATERPSDRARVCVCVREYGFVRSGHLSMGAVPVSACIHECVSACIHECVSAVVIMVCDVYRTYRARYTCIYMCVCVCVCVAACVSTPRT